MGKPKGGWPALATILLLFGIALFWGGHSFLPQASLVFRPEGTVEEEITEQLEGFFNLRTQALIRGEEEGLEVYYDLQETTGQWAWESEQARIAYVSQWAENRQVRFASATCDLVIVSLEVEEDKGWASVCPHIIVTYQHGDSRRLDLMGARTVHWLELIQRDGRWLVQKDWYLDPFEGRRDVPASGWEDPSEGYIAVASLGARDIVVKGEYDRERAVRYANRYAGIRLGPTTGRYNQAYRDYSMGGGDCANFASQVLADEEGGGLPQDWVWFYGPDGGSKAWVQAEALVNHFINTGRAQLLKRGSFAEVTQPTSDYWHGAIKALQPGDIIGYEVRGRLSHVSVVVGTNSKGYPVVNSHSADRFQVPWDLGYDKETRFWLVAIKG